MAQTKGLETAKVSRKKSTNSFWSDIKNTSFGESRSYLFEYGLQLLLLASLLSVVMAMFRSLFDFMPNTLLSRLYGGDAYVWLVAAFTVILPLTIILIQRTAESERADARLKNLAWRKVFLGIFLTFVGVWGVLSSILFIESILSYLSVGFMTQADFDWEKTTVYLFATFVLVTTSWVYGNDYRSMSKDQFARLRHQYRYGLVGGALFIGLLFLILPFRESRQVMIDRIVVGDLMHIEKEVNSFVEARGYMPEALSDLNMTTKQTQRSNTYLYTYERLNETTYQLCADFFTSSAQNDKSLTTLSALGIQAGEEEGGLWQHNGGRDCFDMTVSIGGGQQLIDTQPAAEAEVQGAEVTVDQPLPADQAVEGVVPEQPIY